MVRLKQDFCTMNTHTQMVSQQEDKSASFHYSAINNHSLHWPNQAAREENMRKTRGTKTTLMALSLYFHLILCVLKCRSYSIQHHSVVEMGPGAPRKAYRRLSSSCQHSAIFTIKLPNAKHFGNRSLLKIRLDAQKY